MSCIFFFFNDTATTEIYTLSLHDALPIWAACRSLESRRTRTEGGMGGLAFGSDRKSTRLNSSHDQISYAVFCLKKKKQPRTLTHRPQVAACRRQPRSHTTTRLLLMALAAR